MRLWHVNKHTVTAVMFLYSRMPLSICLSKFFSARGPAVPPMRLSAVSTTFLVQTTIPLGNTAWSLAADGEEVHGWCERPTVTAGNDACLCLHGEWNVQGGRKRVERNGSR